MTPTPIPPAPSPACPSGLCATYAPKSALPQAPPSPTTPACSALSSAWPACASTPPATPTARPGVTPDVGTEPAVGATMPPLPHISAMPAAELRQEMAAQEARVSDGSGAATALVDPFLGALAVLIILAAVAATTIRRRGRSGGAQ